MNDSGTGAKAWDDSVAGWKKWDKNVLENLQPIGERLLELVEIKTTDVVLDVATGTGQPGLTAAQKAAKVAGVDVSAEMVKAANEKARALGVNNYEAVVADALSLPFPDNSFDAVVCRHGVMFFPDPLLGLKEMARVLKRGGRMAVSVWGPPERNPRVALAMKVLREMGLVGAPKSGEPGLFALSEKGKLLKLLDEAGFSHGTAEEEISGESAFQSAEEYWGFISEVPAPVVKALGAADEAAREAVREKVTAEALKWERDGKIVFPWSARIASGRK